MIMQAEVPVLPLLVCASFCVLTMSSLEKAKAKTHSIFLCVAHHWVNRSGQHQGGLE